MSTIETRGLEVPEGVETLTVARAIEDAVVKDREDIQASIVQTVKEFSRVIGLIRSEDVAVLISSLTTLNEKLSMLETACDQVVTQRRTIATGVSEV